MMGNPPVLYPDLIPSSSYLSCNQIGSGSHTGARESQMEMAWSTLLRPQR
jgi:hypothetical protein